MQVSRSTHLKLLIARAWIGVLAGVVLHGIAQADPARDPVPASLPQAVIGGQAPGISQSSEHSPKAVESGAMSLPQLTDLALRNNPATREAWAMVNVEAAAVGMAEAEYWPTVDATVALTRGKNSVNSSTGVVAGNAQTRLSPGISLSYLLFDFGARSSALDAARYNLLAANLNRNREMQTVVFQVEQAYYQLLAATQTVTAGEEMLKAVLTSLEVVSAWRKAGLATVGSVYQAQTLVAQTRLQLRQAEGAARKFKGALCHAVGLPVNSNLMLADIASPPPLRQVRLSVEHYLEQAKSGRSDLRAAEAQSRAAHAATDVASAQGYPTLDLAINAGKTYNNFQLGAVNNGSTSGTIGINLRVPLFNGWYTTNAVRQAQAHAEQSDAQQQRATLQIELEVWQAYFDLDTAEAAIANAQALSRSAILSREVEQARYQAGVGNLSDWLSAQAGEANARMEVIQAEMGWYSSVSRLNNAIGNYSAK